MKYSVLIAAAALFFSSCGRENQCDTPFGEGAQVDVSLPEFAALQNVGGSMTINRGHHGIFVRRVSFADFVAFECTCPKDHDTRLLADADWGGAVLSCPDCGSKFETEYGTPLEGAATPCLLDQYNTSFNGVMLEIY